MTINESIYMSLSVSESSKVPVLLMGNPGAGKTTTVEYYAELTGKKMILLRGSQSSPEEILGYEVNSDEKYAEGPKAGSSMNTTTKLRPKWYMELMEVHEKGIPTLLFLDEITTASEHIQSALLQLIFGRSLDNENKIPDDCLIVAAGNYASNLSSQFNLIPPLMNRFCIFNVTPKKEDLKLFLSKYQNSQDPLSALRSFDIENSLEGTLDKSFIDVTKQLSEDQLCKFVSSLMDDGKFNPALTDMSDIYSDQSSDGLPGFITLRTLNYFRDTFISTYLKYGMFGIKSPVFSEMTKGLVGLSLSGTPKSIKTVSVLGEFVNFSIKLAEKLDKKKNLSIGQYEDSLNKILYKLSTKGDKVPKSTLTSAELISLEKIFNSSIEDKSLRKIEKPISEEILIKCKDAIINSVRDVLKDDIASIKSACDASSKGEDGRSMIDLNKINGSLKSYNDALRSFKLLKDFVDISNFNYSSELTKSVDSDKMILITNRYKIETAKKWLKDKVGVSMSELIELEML